MKKILLFVIVAVLCLGLTALALTGLIRGREVSPAPTPEPERMGRIWLDGTLHTDWPVWEGVPYLPLQTLAEEGDGSLREFYGLRLKAWGRHVKLLPDRAAARVEGHSVELPGPCRFYRDAWYVPTALLTSLGMEELKDPEQDQIFYTRVPEPDRIPGRRKVVILRCHCVSDDLWGDPDLFLSPARVEELICRMEDMGCSFLTFEDLERIDEYEKPVFLTCDDGYRDNYTELFPILKRHGAKATIFLVTGVIGQERCLTEDMITEMDQSGLVSFQSHTVSHRGMDQATEEEVTYEAAQPQLAIARLLGKGPFVLSFPEARATWQAMEVVSRYYRYVVIADGEPWTAGEEPLHIPRFAMPRDIDDETFLDYFSCFD